MQINQCMRMHSRKQHVFLIIDDNGVATINIRLLQYLQYQPSSKAA